MAQQRGGHGGRGQHDLFEELFGKGAFKRADASRSANAQSQPAWARWATLAVAIGLIAFVVHGWVLPSLPGGGSRDDLLRWLRVVVGWAPWAVAFCVAASVVSGVWAYRKHQREQAEEDDEARKKQPTASDRAAALAVKLPAGSVRVAVRRKRLPPRTVRQVEVTAPAGALLDNPGRSWCVAVGTVLGVELAPVSWDVGTGKAVLEPGALPPEPVETLPPTATTPVARAEQAITSLLGRQGQIVESDVESEHPDGTPIEFVVRHAPSPRLASEERQALFSEYLSSMMPAAKSGRGWDVIPEPVHDRVRIIERPPMESLILRPIFDEREYFDGKDILAVGQDEQANYVGWDCSVSTLCPHCLLVGPTGLGKTNLLRSIILSASRYGFETRAADPKRIELLGMDSWPGVSLVATSVDAIRSLISDAYDEMDRRYTRIERRKADPADMEPLLVLLDEYYIMRTLLEFAHKNETDAKGNPKKGAPQELGMIAKILAMARTARLHMLLGLQRPDADNFPDGARDNAQARISLGPMSPQAAGMIWPGHHRAATQVPRMHGRGLIADEFGAPRTFQAWFTPSMDEHPRVRARLKSHERERIDALRPDPPLVSQWTQRDSHLVVPAGAGEDRSGGGGVAAPPRPGTPEAALDGVTDIIRARNLLEHMRIRLTDSSGALVDAVVEHTDSPTDEVMIADLLIDGQPLQREFDGAEEVWLLDTEDEI